MAMRTAMHRAGASALSRLLRGSPPGADEREVPCPCGHKARYREMRARRVLTAVGEVELLRAWYLCTHCHNGQCPADAALDIEKTDFSPGVRRMPALVGSEAPFDHGRQQIELLAGLEVTAKAVERTAEAIGADIAAGERREIQRALQLSLPMTAGQSIPSLYVEMDGTGVPVVKAETQGRAGKVRPRCVPSTRRTPNYLRSSASKPTTSITTGNECDIRSSVRNTSLSAPALSRQAAKPSLVPVASSLACSGPFAAQTPFWTCAAVTSTRASRIIGRPAKQLDFHSQVAHPIRIFGSGGGIQSGAQSKRDRLTCPRVHAPITKPKPLQSRNSKSSPK